MTNIFEFNLGDVHFWHVQTHKFGLDGGSMFGVVPKVIWEKFLTSDEKNRIPMATNILFFKYGKNIGVVDTGLGTLWNDKEKEIYKIQENLEIWENLPFSPEDVNFVFLTHLHFDHAGGNTSEEGKVFFKNAKYVVQKDELQEALNPNERTRRSYRKIDIEPIIERLITVDGTLKFDERIYLIKTGGHTRGHQLVLIHTSNGDVLFMGDICPTIHHIPIPYIMAYDLYPMETLRFRKTFYPHIVENNFYLVFEHDYEPKRGYLRYNEQGYYLVLKEEP